MDLTKAEVGQKYLISHISQDKEYLEILGIKEGYFVTIDNKSLMGMTYKITIDSNNIHTSFYIPKSHAKNIVVL